MCKCLAFGFSINGFIILYMESGGSISQGWMCSKTNGLGQRYCFLCENNQRKLRGFGLMIVSAKPYVTEQKTTTKK